MHPVILKFHLFIVRISLYPSRRQCPQDGFISCEIIPSGTPVQDLVEAGEEGDGCNGRCQNITDRLGEKDAEALICREAGQDKNQRDKQDDLAQTGQQELTLA